ncbi:hypothetical protein MYX77_11770, partial [Acidobacteriia bacterium AH_259_A11_L15]|nr:hypothetical protein [Acidobacteriia bacterium AH_259_A11_L15]
APYTWSEPTAFFSDTTGAGAIGTACEGLTLDLTATGLTTTISGTPPNDGDCGPFTVRIDDAGSPGQFDEQSPTITTTSLDDGVNGQAYSVDINASGGTLPLTWSETTAFFDDTTGVGVGSCAGLTLDLSATGRTTTITGTPTSTGTCGPFTIEVQDNQNRTDTQELSIAIFDPLTITTTSLPNGTEDQVNYLATINATGGNGPFTWTRSTNVPPGLDLTASTTASVDLTGDPTTGGAFTFTVQVDDSANPAQSDTRQFTVRILEVTTTGLPDAVENQLYSSGPLTAVGLNPLATPMWGAGEVYGSGSAGG